MTRASFKILAPRSCWVLHVLLALALLLAGCGVPDQPTAQSQTPAAALTATASPQAGADVNVTVSALMLIEMQAARATAQSQPTAATSKEVTTPAPTFDAAYYVTHPEVWPTHSPKVQTQVAMIDANATAAANYAATSFALPPAPQGGPRSVYPTTSPVVGILENCYSMNTKTQFATWSCWQERDGARTITVRAGGESGAVQKREDSSKYQEDDASIRGGVFVCVYTPNDSDPIICDPPYWRPEREGRLKIVAAEGMRLTLEAVTGSRYVFNVETRAWEAAPAVPVPTATPLPTDVPPPTFTPRPTVLPVAVRPVFECVAPNADGSFTA